MNKQICNLIIVLLGAVLTISSCKVLNTKQHYVNKTYQEIQSTFPEAHVSLVQDSIKIIFPNNIVFDLGSTALKSTFEKKLTQLASILKKFDKNNLLITGHTDNTGNESNNLTLSLERAKVVKRYLVNTLISKERLFVWGMGEKNAIATNNTQEGRLQNRRVEFVVLYQPTK